jgi:hypothetical protein
VRVCDGGMRPGCCGAQQHCPWLCRALTQQGPGPCTCQDRGRGESFILSSTAVYLGFLHVGHNKWICGSEWVEHRSHTYIRTFYTARPVHGVHSYISLICLSSR